MCYGLEIYPHLTIYSAPATNISQEKRIFKHEKRIFRSEKRIFRQEKRIFKQEKRNLNKKNEYLDKKNEYLNKKKEYLDKKNEYLLPLKWPSLSLVPFKEPKKSWAPQKSRFCAGTIENPGTGAI